MFCHKCGTQLSEEAKFCYKCGAKVPEKEAGKEVLSVPTYNMQKREKSILSEEQYQDDAGINEQHIEPMSVLEDNTDFKEFVNKHVRENTKFQSAEELLNSKVPQKFLWIWLVVPAICLFMLFNHAPILDTIFGGIALLLLVVYPIALLIDSILSLRVNKGEFKTNGSVDTDDLIQFLNRNMRYLSPYFNEWNYIQMVGFGIRGMAVAAIQNAVLGTRIGTEFGRRKSCFVEIHIDPDSLNPESGQMVYFFSTAIKSLWPAKYVCKVKAVPILQAAMEYYLKEPCEKNVSVQPDAPNPSGSIQPQDPVLTAAPKKKKSKKLLIVPAIIFAFVVILIAAKMNDSEKADGYEAQQNSTGVSLSQTYRNDEEGIGFKYPAAWVPVSEDEFVSRYGDGEEYPVVFLANEEKDLPEENSYVMVSRFDVAQEDIDHLFIDDGEFAATFDDDATIETTFVTQIDGIAARKIVYHEKNGISFQSYFYAVGSILYRVDFIYFGESAGNKQRFFDAIIGSYEITSGGDATVDKAELPDAGEAEQPQEEIFGFETDYREAYSDKIRELTAMDDTFQFALIDLIGNDVPELVADHSGYDVSVFTWVDEAVITVMDQWSYGAMGNMGYEYLPGRNVIRNYNMESAGAIIYEVYMMVDDNYEVVNIFSEDLSIRHIRDTNANGIIDEEDEYSDEPVYYCNETEISEEEYVSWQITGDYERIAGDMSADAMIDLLQ